MSFSVDTEEARRLASEFRASTARLTEHAATFAGQARLGPDAFGALPSSVTAHGEYAARLEQAFTSLERLCATLSQFAANLDSVVSNYEQADWSSSARGTST